MPSWDEPEDPEGGMIHGLQAMLNSARKAEARMTKALNARARTTAQWNNFEEQLKRTYAKEKQRFAQITQKQDNDIAEAKAAQSTARAAVRQAYHNADADAQLPSKPSCASEWEALKAAWDQEQNAELGGVYRRAMLEDKITPHRGRVAAPRSPNPGQHPALKTATDPYLAYPDAGTTGPVASPAPVGATAENGQEAVEPNGPSQPEPRREKAGPRKPLKDQTKTSPKPADLGGQSLGDKLDQVRRSAMQPFGGPGIVLPPAGDKPPSAEAVDISMDDDDELDTAAPSPGLGKLE